VIPGLVLEVVIEHQALALLPRPGLAAHAQRAVSVGHGDRKVTAQPQVRRSPVRADVHAGSHPRHIDQPGRRAHRRQGLDPLGDDRTGLAHLLAPSPALIEEDHVPVARSFDALALRLKAGRLQREYLVTDLREMCLQIAGQRELRRLVPRP